MKFYYFFFQLLIFFLPTQLAKHFWPEWAFIFGIRIDYFAPAIFITDILIFLTLVFWLVEEKPLSWQKNRNFFLSLGSLVFFAFLNSQSPLSFFKWLKFFELFIFGYFVAREWGKLKTKITIPLLGAIFYTGVIASGQFILEKSLGGMIWWLGERQINIGFAGMPLARVFGREFLRPFASFSHPNQMAGFIFVSLLLVLEKPLTKFKLAALASGAVALLLSFSQNAWLGVFGVFFFSLVVNKNNFSKFKNIFLPLLFFLSLAQIFFAQGLLSRDYLFFDFIQKRLELIWAAGAVFAKAPFFGVGLGSFIVHLPTLSQWWLQPVHNIYLLILVETGIVGFLVCFWFLKKAIVFLDKKLFLSLVFILLTGFFDHYWLTLQQTQILLTIILGASFSKNVRIENKLWKKIR